MRVAIKSVGSAHRHLGAARVSVFFALWTGALFVLQELRVEAAPVFETNSAMAAPWWTSPLPPPVVETRAFWSEIDRHSEVMNGTWQQGESESSKPPATKVEKTPHVAVAAEEHVSVVESVAATKDVVVIATRPSITVTSAEEKPVSVRVERQEREDPGRAAKREARAAIARGDDEGAYRVLTEAGRHAGTDQEHYDLLAAVMVRTARFEEAADVYAALIAGDASNPRLWAGYAMALESIGRTEPSQIAYRNVLRTASSGTPLHELATSRLQRIG